MGKQRLRIYMMAVWLTAIGASAGNPLKLVYDRPAEFFEETLVIGNGTTGAAIYGGAVCDSLSLNDITLWSGEPEKTQEDIDHRDQINKIRVALDRGDYVLAEKLNRVVQGNYSQSFQPLGRLYLSYPGRETSTITNYRRELDLKTATATITYDVDGMPFEVKYLASAPDSALVVRLDSKMSFDVRLSLGTPHPHEAGTDNLGVYADGYAPYYARPVYHQIEGKNLMYDPNRGIHFRMRLNVSDCDGKVTTMPDGTIEITGATRATVGFADATSFNGFDRDPVKEGKNYRSLADNRIRNVAKRKFKDLEKRHRDDYGQFFDRVSIDLGESDPEMHNLTTDRRLMEYSDNRNTDPDLEELYFQFGRYLLISSSRTEGVPANLQGLWNESQMPPWSSNYTVNINLEENYWPAGVANLGEAHEAMLTFLDGTRKNGQRTARQYYGVDNGGWCNGHNSDIWAHTDPVGEGTGSASWACWNMGGAWMATHVWEQYLFNRDKEMLKKYYPILRDAAKFCLGWMVEKDGYLITSPSTSPENMFYTSEGKAVATSYGGFADMAIIRECLTAAAAAAQAIDADADLRAEIDAALPRLLPYRVGSRGNLSEWYYDWKEVEPEHRHQSHLIGLYPGHHITPEKTPQLAAACARSLDLKGDKTTGWSTGWRINLRARLKDGVKAYETYRTLLKYVSPDQYKGTDARRGGGTYPNLMDAHSPFQIDGNFGGTAGVAEMLVQSSAHSISLLPALPGAWQIGSAAGLGTRTGATIDMEWADGKVVKAEIHPRVDERVSVNMNGETRELSLKAGKSVTLRPGK